MEKNIKFMKKIIITKKDNLEEEINSGSMSRFAGVSEGLSGAKNIHLAIATIPKDRCSTTHFHTNCESAIYVLSGSGIFLHGEKMDIEEEINEGDFIFVPPFVPHQEINASKKEVLKCILFRSGQDPIVVNLDIPEAEEHNNKLWVDDIHIYKK